MPALWGRLFFIRDCHGKITAGFSYTLLRIRSYRTVKKQKSFPYSFFLVTFLWSWLIWLPLVLTNFGFLPLEKDLLSMINFPIIVLAAFGPAVGAFYCLRKFNGKGAVRQYLYGLLDVHFGWKAWLIPILVLGSSTWIAWILPELWGEPRLGMYLPAVWVFPFWVLIMVFLGGGQEELGWRGYILDHMEARFGPWLGNLILGTVWAIWHLPLFFIPGSTQIFMPFLAFLLNTIGYSWFFAWVRLSSGKRTLAGLVVHGWANAFAALFPILVMAADAAQPRYWIWAGLNFAIGLITMVVRSQIRRSTKAKGAVRLVNGAVISQPEQQPAVRRR
jgi:membrane protease YdiL (CAAX protease family)